MAAPQSAFDPRFGRENSRAEGLQTGSSFAPIYISGSGWEHSYHPLDLLARFIFMLPSFGTAGMAPRTRYELRIAALMLAVVGCFEVTAWAFVFHQFTNGSGWEILLVTLAALMVGAAMTMLERSIFVSDMDVRARELGFVWLKILLRVGIILFVAFKITSQPVKLIMFRPSIEARIFEEDVRRNLASAAMDTINKLRELQQRADAYYHRYDKSNQYDVEQIAAQSADKTELARGQASADDAQIASLRGQIASRQAGLDKAEATVNRLEPSVAPYLRSPDSTLTSASRELVSEFRDARARASQLRGQIRNLENQSQAKALDRDQQLQQARVSDLDVQRLTEGKGIKPPTASEFKSAFDNFAKFAATLLRARKREDVKDTVGFGFGHKDYTDVEKLALVQDFQDRRAPRPEKLAEIALLDNGNSQAQPGDDRLSDQLEKRVRRAFKTYSDQLDLEGSDEALRMHQISQEKYWMIVGIAVVVPMVALIYKVTAGKELRNYYSQQFQAGSFNPEALLQAVTEEHIESEKRNRAAEFRRRAQATD